MHAHTHTHTYIHTYTRTHNTRTHTRTQETELLRTAPPDMVSLLEGGASAIKRLEFLGFQSSHVRLLSRVDPAHIKLAVDMVRGLLVVTCM